MKGDKKAIEFLQAQLDACFDDFDIHAVKLGMLSTIEVIDTVREWLERVRPGVVVLDPVMVATSGGYATAAAIGGARLVILPGMGHDIAPGLVNILVDLVFR